MGSIMQLAYISLPINQKMNTRPIIYDSSRLLLWQVCFREFPQSIQLHFSRTGGKNIPLNLPHLWSKTTIFLIFSPEEFSKISPLKIYELVCPELTHSGKESLYVQFSSTKLRVPKRKLNSSMGGLDCCRRDIQLY